MALTARKIDVAAPKSSLRFPGGVTVLMAVYWKDSAKLFESAVRSIYENTLAPDDFVLVVDGPLPQELEGAVQKVEARWGTRVVRLAENLGLAAALNRGLQEIRTCWVARADADDISVPARLECQARALVESSEPLDVIGADLLEVAPDGRELAVRRVPANHGEIRRRLSARSPFNHPTVVFRAETVRRVGGYPSILCKEDYALWGRLAAEGARFANVAEPLVRATTGLEMYRRRGGLRYVLSEWSLQAYLVKIGVKSKASAATWGTLRSLMFLMPSRIRGALYEGLLRQRPKLNVGNTLSGVEGR